MDERGRKHWAAGEGGASVDYESGNNHKHRKAMTKLLVLYYSMYGHVEKMAGAIAEGARSVKEVEVTVKRVPELMSEETAKKAGAKLDQAAPVASPKELAD